MSYVHIIDGGVASYQRLAAPTVGQLLSAAVASLQQDDKVVPPASTPVIEGMQIVVTRIREHNVAARLPLSAPLRRIQDPTLNIGRHVDEDPALWAPRMSPSPCRLSTVWKPADGWWPTLS